MSYVLAAIGCLGTLIPRFSLKIYLMPKDVPALYQCQRSMSMYVALYAVAVYLYVAMIKLCCLRCVAMYFGSKEGKKLFVSKDQPDLSFV